MVVNDFFSKSFLEAINAVAESDDNKFVIILGSGFHRHYLSNICGRDESDSLHMLCDWGKLLQPLSHEYQFSGHYLRDFEDIIARLQDGTDYKESSRERELAASEIEKRLLKQIQENLRSAQYTVVSKFSENIPLWLFNPDIISDVVSLNFDLIPEILLNKPKKLPLPAKIENIPIKSDVNITRHRTVNGIKFWHPHGDTASYKSMVLSLRKYGMILPQVEQLRQHFKANENKTTNNNKSFTWFDRIAKQPVLIIGASISDLEWDIWFALANRKRNFAKRNFKKNEQPIFKMVGPCETLDKNWFSELTFRKETYPCQWEHMQDLFNKYGILSY